MPSQFFGLNIAGSGLRNSNAALNTTANNISNVQTEGYSRQKVDSQAADALRTFTTYGCAGAGVETIAIERVRDSFYDVKYWNNNSNLGQFKAKAYYMKSIEDYLKDDGISGFVSVFNKMSNCLQSVTTNSSSVSSKSQFVASAEALTDYFNTLYGNLQELQKDINLEIKQCLDFINSTSEQIATLNEQINVIELTGSRANDLRDQRDVLVDKLSEFIDVETSETPIYDTNDPTRETGGSRYVLKIAGGQILIDSSDYSTLNVVARQNYEKINQCDVDGLYKVTWDNGNEFNLNNASLNGKLKGLVELRDGNNGVHFNGKVTDVGADTPQPDGDTISQVKIQVTDEALKTVADCALPPYGEIVINNATYYYTGWTFDGTDSYTFDISKDKYKGADKPITAGAAAQTQDAIKYEGIPYFMTQMNAFIRSFFGSVNDSFEHGWNSQNNTNSVYTDESGFKCAENLFTAELPNGQMTQEMLETKDSTKQFNNRNGYYYMTAGSVRINTNLKEDASKLGTRSAEHMGVEECGQVEKVIAKLSNAREYSFRNAPANQMLEMILSDVAINASDASTYEKTFKSLQTSIDNQRTSISGVDEDEEAVNLVKYQNAYTLASKMISTLTEIYDQLILRTGI